MKKNSHILLIVLIACTKIIHCQDIIYTVEGKVIQAKVLELTDEKLSYKKFDYQDGPVIVLDLSKVNKVVWQNGDIDLFNDVTEVKTTQIELNRNTFESKEVGNIENTLPVIYRKQTSFYLDNGTVFNETQFEDFLKVNNMVNIWEQYYSGKKTFHTGIALLVGGVIMEGTGLWFGYTNSDALMASVLLIGLGSLLEIASIPVTITGAVKRNRALNDYNDMYAGKARNHYSQDITLKIGATSHGVGLTLNF